MSGSSRRLAQPRSGSGSGKFASFPSTSTLTSSTSSALFSYSSITFIASWRGQLLVCIVLFAVGAIYFFVRQPIDDWSRRRREALSRKREEELLSSVEKEGLGDKEDGELDDEGKEGKVTARERGREKRKEVKKRKGSLLRVSAATESTGQSSIESSPAPTSIRSTLGTTPSSTRKSRSILTPTNQQAQTPPNIKVRKTTDERIVAPSPRHAPPPPIVLPRHDLSPWDIPLPESPGAGPSRLVPASGYYASDDASESAQSSRVDSRPAAISKSDGFSIIPDDGYLPAHMPISGKKKKKKGKAVNGQASIADESGQEIAQTNGSAAAFQSPHTHPSHLDNKETTGDNKQDCHASNAAPPRLRHTRTSSIAARPDISTADLREIVEQRDATIDNLRGEIGLAKAEEAKARDEVGRARLSEERMKSDYDRLKRHSRQRESELQSRLSQIHAMYTQAAQRLGSYESALRETGGNLSLPALPSPVPMQFPPSPMPGIPLSPYASSPVPGRHTPMSGGGSGAFIPYPSPAMYPSPMLHPNSFLSHSHAQSPTPYRRTSGTNIVNGGGHVNGSRQNTPGPSGDDFSLAGPLTPGLGGLYPPMDIGSGTMPIGAPGLGHPINVASNGSGSIPIPNGTSMSAARRQSIESSVLKKKAKALENDLVNSADGGAGGEMIREEEGGSSQPSRSGSPSSSTLQRHGKVNGCGDESAKAIAMLCDGEKGNIYYSSGDGQNVEIGPESDMSLGFDVDADEDGSANASLSDGNPNGSGSGSGNGSTRASISEFDNNADDNAHRDASGGDASLAVALEPMFASLAHTPAQVEEMRRIRERAQVQAQAQVRERGRSVSASTAATTSMAGTTLKGRAFGGGGGALGVGGLLTPSPSKSPVPLRG